MLQPVQINIKLSKKPADALQGYCLYYIDEEFDENENPLIIQKIQESKIIIINILDYDKKELFVGFNKTIIHAKKSIKLLQSLFSKKPELKFYILQNNKKIDNSSNIFNITQDQIFQITKTFDMEINNFNNYLKINHPKEDPIYQMQKYIKSCISGYLIGESYFKSIEEQKIDFSKEFNKLSNQKQQDESNIKEWTEDEYIELRQVGAGSSISVELIYQIETGHLFAIKKISDSISLKLNEREYKNYLAINYPLIPKFYGRQKENKYLIIQYIHGQTLDKIDLQTLTEEDKIVIIFELMFIIKYLHEKNFVYRDLKPNNIIVDENKTAFLIDFDRMLKKDLLKNDLENFTNYFTDFTAPEVNYGEITNKNDIYSLGKMIQYLQLEISERINPICLNYTNERVNQRPSI